MSPKHHGHLIDLAVRLLLLLSVVIVIHSGVVDAAQITWTNTAGGDWSDPANWSPNQVPGPADTASITNPGTYVVTLITNGTVGSLVLGGAGSGAQTLQASGFVLTAGSVSVNSGGVLYLLNEGFEGAVTAAGGGLLQSYGATLSAAVTIESGGRFLLLGPTTIGELNATPNTNDWLWLQSGGELDTAPYSGLRLYSVMTNAGVANFITNSGITLYNDGTSGSRGGVWNQPSGVLNFMWNSSTARAISGSLGADYLVNEGTINVSNYQSTSISVASFSSPGTVTVRSAFCTLRIGTFNGPGSLTGTYNAAVNTTIQFVGGNNPGVSPGTPLVLGGAGRFQFVSGTLTLPTDVVPGLAMTGGNLLLGAAFQGGAITNLTLNGVNLTNNLPIGGTLIMTNGTLVTTSTLTDRAVLSLNNVTMYGAVDVAAGGLLSSSRSTLWGQVAVQSGGKFQLSGPTTMGQVAQSGNAIDWLWVQSGGELDAASGSTLYLSIPMTNAGLANLTNSGINLYNNGTSLENGEVWNQPGGVLNLIGNGGMTGGNLLNQGSINAANGNTTINVTSLTNLGMIGTLPGTGSLRIGTFNGLGSLFGTYSAAAGTTIQFASTSSPGTSAGTPLVLGGAGQYLFASGTLTLMTNVIPGLEMTNGNLVLGPGFQGGAITNLALDGISLSNNLPIVGTLNMTNGTLTTITTLSNGTMLTLNGVTMYGAINVGAGGLFKAGGSTLAAQVTVQNRGEFLLFNYINLGQAGQNNNMNDWLWVQNGGELDASEIAVLYLFSAMTNAGLVNVTNYGITIYNNETSGYHGGIWNQASGVMNLFNATISGLVGLEYIVNQGTINSVSSIGTSTINVNNFTNTGILTALYGPLELRSTHLTLEPSGTLSVGLSSATNYGVIDIQGNAPLAGAFGVTLNNGFVPQLGTSFNVVTYSSLSGAFNDTNFQAVVAAPAFPGLQQTVSFETTYSSAFMIITAEQLSRQFAFAGSNGPPGQPYVVLSSTDLTLPRAAWTPMATNYFDANGSFIFTSNLDPATPKQFFTYRYQ